MESTSVPAGSCLLLKEHDVFLSCRVVSVCGAVAETPSHFIVVCSERKYLTTHLDNRHVKPPELGLSLCTLQNVFIFSW